MIVFLSNHLIHHQYPISSALYELTGHEFVFIEMQPMPKGLKQSGYPEYDVEWKLEAWKGDDEMQRARQLLVDASIVISTIYTPQCWLNQRLRSNKLTFNFSERWLKRGFINILSPHLFKFLINYHVNRLNKRPYYALCASAYAAKDFNLFGLFKNKCFKWGYFPSIPQSKRDDITHKSNKVTRIIYVARFLNWKHPEMPVKMATRLLASGRKFELNMFGTGPEMEKIKKSIISLGLTQNVRLLGNKPNREILDEMRNHDIFVFTSDRNEGWGAVVNEAMGCGCAVVSSDAVGCAPYLINDNVNGMIFRSGSVTSLTDCVEKLIDNPSLCESLRLNARRTMTDVWSPENAAKSFVKLCNGLTKDNSNVISIGPCTPA